MNSYFDHKNIQTQVSCRICGGPIVRRTAIPYIPRQSADMIGPGSANVVVRESDRQTLGLNCDTCGIEYYKLPKG